VNAGAFVVGSAGPVSDALFSLAQQAGMTPVLRYSGLANAEKQMDETPLVFFLCAAVPDVKTLKPMADAIRFSPTRGIRFSPLVYFAASPSVEAIRSCINMGFDDIIALPCPPRALAERVARQIGQLCTYYETSNYFGPDRRGRIEVDLGDPRRGNGTQFRRIEIMRTFETGVDVIKDDMQVEL
jgi:PleD family two-component response regulator